MRIEKTEQGKTKNGLRYYLFPRTGFGEQIAAVLVQRGANHLFWKGRDGEKICFPQGTAHFIEHKLFQQEWGDAFARFTQNGASANAFTDGDRVLLTALRDKLMGDKKLASMARTSDPQIFVESIFPKAFGDAAMESYTESQDTYTSLFEDQNKYNAIMSALAEVIYREMRKKK